MFFAMKMQAELGKLVILDTCCGRHPTSTPAPRSRTGSARLILENQQSPGRHAAAGPERRLRTLGAATGMPTRHEAAEGHFRSLEPGFTPQVPWVPT